MDALHVKLCRVLRYEIHSIAILTRAELQLMSYRSSYEYCIVFLVYW
jgi:hypothetical protein